MCYKCSTTTFAVGQVNCGYPVLQVGYSSPSQEGIMRDLHLSLAEVLLYFFFVQLDVGQLYTFSV